MNKMPFVIAKDVEGEERIPPRVSKLLLAPETVGTRSISMGLNVTAVGSMIPDLRWPKKLSVRAMDQDE